MSCIGESDDARDPRTWLYIMRRTMIPTNSKYFRISDRLDRDAGRNKKTNSTKQKAMSTRVKDGKLFFDAIK